jgi:nucleoside-triphosphatase
MNNILLTGAPGLGKTTAIRNVARLITELHPCGFFTAEIRERGMRKGFELVEIGGGTRAILSHVDIQSRFQVGRYGVDLAGFERFLDSIPLFRAGKRPVVIDEIGKMECFSRAFRDTVTSLLDGPGAVLATVAIKGGGFIEEVKRRKDVTLFEITLSNRDSLLGEVADFIRARAGPP